MAQMLFAFVIAMWIMGFGLSLITQQHRHYVAWTGRAIRSILLQTGRLVQWLVHRYRHQIFWMVAGCIATLVVLHLLGTM
jgi:hypothetical protein